VAVLLAAGPAGATLTFEGINAWRSPCLLSAEGDNVEPLGRVGCIGPVEASSALGRPFTFRFGVRRTVVLAEGWDRYSRAVAYLNANGAQGLPIITTEGLLDPRLPSSAYRAFVRDTIERLDAGTFEIANEPNSGAGGEFTQDPRAFGNRLCSAYRGWRDAGSHSDVSFVTGGLATPSRSAALDYLDHTANQLERSCGAAAWSRFSAIGVHLYARTPYEAAGTVVALHAWLHHRGLEHVRIAITEYAWSSTALGEHEQRDNQVEFQQWAHANRHKCGIAATYWFASRDRINETKGLGLTHSDSSPKLVFWSWLAFLGDHGIAGDAIASRAVSPGREHLARQTSGRACRRAHP